MVTYPEDWREVKLGEALVYTQPTNYIENNYVEHGVVPVLTAGKSFILGYSDKTDSAYKNLPAILFDDFTTEVRYLDYPFMVKSSATKFLNLKSDYYDIKYLYYWLDKLKFQIEAHERHWISRFSKFNVVLPSLQEQQAIASALSDFDEHIDNLSELIEKKKAIRDGSLEDLVSGRTRLDGFNGEWIESTIEDSTKEIITGGTPSTTVDKYWGGSIPWLASTEIHQKIITRATKNITNIGLNNSSAKMAPKDSVLIALAGQGKTRGTAAFLAYPMALNQSLAALVAADETDSKFLYYLIENMYLELRELSSGDGGRGGLNKTLIKNINIRLPREIKEQHAIAEVLTAMDEEIESLKIEKEKMIQIKEGAMDDLLTGRVRLKV